MSKKRAKTSSITKRWVFGNLLWVAVILILAGLAVVAFVRNSYYNSAVQSISYRVTTTLNRLPAKSLPVRERTALMRSYVEEFPEKEKFEMMLINSYGMITTTSSGFSVESSGRPRDYLDAYESIDGFAYFTGYSGQGEHIIAATKILPEPIGEIVAIRFVTSLTEVDNLLRLIASLVLAAVTAILIFTAASGRYFIRSIVNPILDIGEGAKEIADGNLDVRLRVDRNDEIGELCEQVNEMAAGLSRAEKMKNDFISSVSHELRTPLTSIKGWGETVSAIGASDEETFRKGMRIIMNEADRLSVMVEDLLDFSRLQSGSMKVELSPLDLVAEITEAVMTVEQRAIQSGVAFEFSEPDGAVPIMGDRDRIRQVFGNLFDNAIKYSHRGGRVLISVSSDDAGAYVSVADEGVGIPKDEIPNVTRRFYKATNSTTGSGIGLAVVYEIMRSHGGDMNIESELGAGTTITLRFNLIEKGYINDQKTLI